MFVHFTQAVQLYQCKLNKHSRRSFSPRAPSCHSRVVCARAISGHGSGQHNGSVGRTSVLPAPVLTAVIRQARNARELEDVFVTHGHSFNQIHVAAALSAAVKLPGGRRVGTEFATGLSAHFVACLPYATHREVSIVLWSLAKLGRPMPHAMVAALLQEEQHRGLLQGAAPQALAQTLWALGSWRNRGPEPLMAVLLAHCDAILPSFGPQDVAQALWSLARLDYHPGASLLSRLVAAASRLAPKTSPQGLAMCAWACWRLGHTDPAFLRAATASFQSQITAASPTDLALMTASLAGLHFRCPQLLRAVAERCCMPLPATAMPTPDTTPTTPLFQALGMDAGPNTQQPGSAITAAGPGTGLQSGLLLRRYSLQPLAQQQQQQSQPACSSWSAHCRQRLLWAFASLGFRHAAAVRALVTLPAGGTWAWIWEPGGSADADGEADGVGADGIGADSSKNNGSDGGDGNVVAAKSSGGGAHLGASGLIWCLGKLVGSNPGPPERAAALAAADALWASRGTAGLSHVAVAAWGLERIGLGQERVLRLACERLATALERCGGGGDNGGSAAGDGGPAGDGKSSLSPPSAPEAATAEPNGEEGEASPARERPGGKQPRRLELSRGDLNAAVMVLAFMGRTGPSSGRDHERVLDAFAAAAPRLLPRLSARQLSLVCVAYARLERSDAAVMGCVATLLMGSEAGATTPSPSPAEHLPSAGVASGGGQGGGLLDRLSRNGLALTLWALASAGYATPALMQRAAPLVMRLFAPPEAVRTAPGAEGAKGDGAQDAAGTSGPAIAPATDAGVEGGWSVEAVAPPAQPAGTATELAVQSNAGHGDTTDESDGSDIDGDGDDDDPDAEPGPAFGAPAGSGVASRWAAMLLWAFAASDCYSPALYDTLLGAATAKLSRLGPGRVALLAWACAVAGHYRREAMERVGEALQEGLESLPPASFTQGVWAMAHLTGGVCLSWSGPSGRRIAALAPCLSSHQAAVLLWAAAVQQLLLLGEGEAEEEDGSDEGGGNEDRDGGMVAEGGGEDAEREDDGDRRHRGGKRSSRAVRPQQREFLSLISRLMRTLAKERATEQEGSTETASAAPSPDHGDGSGEASKRVQQREEEPLESGIALIAAEALALLLASPNADVRRLAESFLSSSSSSPSFIAISSRRRLPSRLKPFSVPVPPALSAQLRSVWRSTQRRRHPQQPALAAAARALGYAPRLLRTHGLLSLATPTAVALPDAAPEPAVVLLAERSDFASNDAGQPLGPLFTTVQLLQERGWRVAVVLAPQFASLRLPRRRAHFLRTLLAKVGVDGPAAAAEAADAATQDAPRALERGRRGQPSGGDQGSSANKGEAAAAAGAMGMES